MKTSLQFLSASARRCLALFQWYWSKFGRDGCFPSVQFIARKLSASATSVKRWTAELARVGLIQKQRRGPRSNRYRSEEVAAENGPSFGPSFGSVSISESSEVKTMQGTASPENESQSQHPASEVEAVQRTVEAFGVPDCGVRLIDRLFSIADYYGKNGYQVAAELYRVLKDVEAHPSMAPKKPGWFPAVLEARLKRLIAPRKPIEVAKVAVPCEPKYAPEEYCPDFRDNMLAGLLAGVA